MLKVQIEKRMPGFTLRVNFSCEKGRLLAMTGPSGAGKTTLIRILAGLDRADSGYISCGGRVWYDSENSMFLPPNERKVGYVFQEHTLFPHLTVHENISCVTDDREKVGDLLRLFRISHIAGRRPHMVSGGERQRAAFAQALASEPEVLLLDEPFSALDPDTRGLLQQELLHIKESMELPVVHVTHDPEEVEVLADKRVFIERDFSAYLEEEIVTGMQVFQELFKKMKKLLELGFRPQRATSFSCVPKKTKQKKGTPRLLKAFRV